MQFFFKCEKAKQCTIRFWVKVYKGDQKYMSLKKYKIYNSQDTQRSYSPLVKTMYYFKLFCFKHAAKVMLYLTIFLSCFYISLIAAFLILISYLFGHSNYWLNTAGEAIGVLHYNIMYKMNPETGQIVEHCSCISKGFIYFQRHRVKVMDAGHTWKDKSDLLWRICL